MGWEEKYGRKLRWVLCAKCGKAFKKAKSECIRNEELGRRNFCSFKCSGSGAMGVFCEKLYNTSKKSLIKFKPLIHFLKEIRKRSKKRSYDTNVTLDDLIELWKKQDGRCPLTNWKLIFPEKGKIADYKQASIDRINSQKGYVVGNIRFVALIVNYAKHTWTDKELLEFCNAVVKNGGGIVSTGNKTCEGISRTADAKPRASTTFFGKE